MAHCETKKEDFVIHQLNELFGYSLDLEIIKNVAMSCKYDVMESSNKLIEITDTETTNLNGDNEDMNKFRSVSYSSALVTSSPSTPRSSSFTPISSSSSCVALSSNKSKKTLNFERVIDKVNKGYKVLIILRGLPGSGKSTLARKILESTIGLDGVNPQLHILSTDDYFYLNARGVYEYDVRKIEGAHYWNQKRAFTAISGGISPVIIDNTNKKMWEMKYYASIGVEHGYILEILEPDTHWCFCDKELSKRNVHGVTRHKIKDMIDQYQKNITPDKLLSIFNIMYKQNKPPQMRLFPPLSTVAKQKKPAAENVSLINFDEEKDSAKDFNGVRDVLVVSSDEDSEAAKNDQLYAQWGIEESTLESWEMFTPLGDGFDIDVTVKQSQKLQEKKETRDGGTCIEEECFRLIRDDRLPSDINDKIKILRAINRDINYSTPKISLKPSLDKSCMTDDYYEHYEHHIIELESLFPAVSKTDLTYLYNKCKGDLEWTIEYLLESNNEVESPVEDDENEKNKRKKVSTTSDKKGKRKIKQTVNKGIPESDKTEIKKILERKFDIGDEHYSQHLRRVKHNVNRISAARDECSSAMFEPTTSKSESSGTSDMEIITIDSDIEYDIEVDKKMTEKSTLEINLGETFVSQLEEKFADSDIQYPKGFLPIVQMPVSLAKQLYAFYIESVYQQMENQEHIMEMLVKEDEEFAKKLQDQENNKSAQHPPSPETPNLKTIMKDQRNANRVYQIEVDKWKSFSPDNLAIKLTKQKLLSIFPTIPPEDLLEVLNAYDNKYQDTLETLMLSTGMERAISDTIMEPPIKDNEVEEMREVQRDHFEEVYKENEEQRKAESYREEASKCLNKRRELYQKAQQYQQRGMTEVAQFYSGLASIQTYNYEKANSMAVTTFLHENSKGLQKFNTIDLHCLYVKEAISAMDVFLDTNINKLKCNSTNKRTEHLNIITGRGKNSDRGISKIKPAVIGRLKKRKIQYTMLNPGLLRVKITKLTLVTSELVE